MSYNDLSGCDCGDCADPTCVCHFYDAVDDSYFKVPCVFNVVSWPGVCAETFTKLCPVYRPARYFEFGLGWHPVVTRWEAADLIPVWVKPTDASCALGGQTLSPQFVSVRLLPTLQGDGTIDWSLDMDWDGIGGASYTLEDWDPWSSQTNGTFTLDSGSITPSFERAICRGSIAPDLDATLDTLIPSTITLQPACFSSGCAASEFGAVNDPTSCYTSSTDCSENSTGSYYSACTGDCTWERGASEWTSTGSTCSGTGCGCGPGPVCGGAEFDVFIETCYELITPSSAGPWLAMATTEPVPLVRKVGNAVRQLRDSGRDVLQGAPLLADEVTRVRRLELCQSCPHSDYGDSSSCKDLRLPDGTVEPGCGCNLAAAIAVQAKKCPIGKW